MLDLFSAKVIVFPKKPVYVLMFCPVAGFPESAGMLRTPVEKTSALCGRMLMHY